VTRVPERYRVDRPVFDLPAMTVAGLPFVETSSREKTLYPGKPSPMSVQRRIITGQKSMIDKRLTVKEVAEALSLSLTAVYALVRSGQIEAERWGGAWRVSPESLEKAVQDARRAAVRHRPQGGVRRPSYNAEAVLLGSGVSKRQSELDGSRVRQAEKLGLI